MKSIIISILFASFILLPCSTSAQKDIDVVQILEKHFIASIDTLDDGAISVIYRPAEMIEKAIERQIILYDEEIESLDKQIELLMYRKKIVNELIVKLESKKSGK